MSETVLQSPLHAWHIAQGASMVAFAGMSLPVQYRGVKPEHIATREASGLFDISHMVQIRLVAAAREDLQAALHRIFSLDFSTFKPGQSRYNFLLHDNGGILDDVIVSDADDHFLIVANGARRAHDPAYLCQLLPETVTLEVLQDRALVALQGPRADEALQQVINQRPALGFMHHATVFWQGSEIQLFRQGYTGEDGWEISVPASLAEPLVQAIIDTRLVTPCGLGARDSLRLEAGLPLWGHDIDANTNPIMAGLDFAIARTRREKADFVGGGAIKKALQNQSSASPEGLLRVGLIGASKQPIREGTPLFDGQHRIGHVTSGGVSPSLGVPIAMGYIQPEYLKPNTSIEAEIRGRRVVAHTTTLPFMPQRYYRAAGASQPKKEQA